MDDENYGPEMAALNDRQRAFVLAMIEHPRITQGKAAELAGYSTSSNGLLRKAGHFLAHHPGVQAAIRAEAGKRLNSASLMAANVLLSLLTDDGVEPKDRIKAAGMLLDRSGFGAAQTINVNKTVRDETDKGAQGRIRLAAERLAKLGFDPAGLLAVMTAPVVEGEFSEVKDGE